MIALLFAAATLAAPSPKPTPQLKVIVNVRSSSLCSAVRGMAIPIGYVTRRNDQAFSAIDYKLISFMQNTHGISDAGAAELRSMENQLDDEGVYTPTNDVTVVQMDQIAYQILQNITLEDGVMNDSWQQYPKGKFESIDAFRQRMQNLIDLQRALAHQYMDFTGIYLDNRGQARFAGASEASYKQLLRSTILGLSSAIADAHSQADPEVLPQADPHGVVHSADVAKIVHELRLQEAAFASEVTTAGQTCGI